MTSTTIITHTDISKNYKKIIKATMKRQQHLNKRVSFKKGIVVDLNQSNKKKRLSAIIKQQRKINRSKFIRKLRDRTFDHEDWLLLPSPLLLRPHLYWEPQMDAQCGKHATNCALAAVGVEKKYTNDEFQVLALKMTIKYLKLIDPNNDASTTPLDILQWFDKSGNYSAVVVQAALAETLGYEFKFFDYLKLAKPTTSQFGRRRIITDDLLDDLMSKGILVCCTGKHWYTLICNHVNNDDDSGGIVVEHWNLDSCSSQPHTISKEEIRSKLESVINSNNSNSNNGDTSPSILYRPTEPEVIKKVESTSSSTTSSSSPPVLSFPPLPEDDDDDDLKEAIKRSLEEEDLKEAIKRSLELEEEKRSSPSPVVPQQQQDPVASSKKKRRQQDDDTVPKKRRGVVVNINASSPQQAVSLVEAVGGEKRRRRIVKAKRPVVGVPTVVGRRRRIVKAIRPSVPMECY